MTRHTDTPPPILFHRGLFWYTDWFDPSADLCCAPDCRALIPEEDVPLILFWERDDGATWQTRIHFECAERLGLFRLLMQPTRES